MGKIWIEVSLISARGLRRSSSLWKLQWFAVGWIDPNNKYCTKIDASGNTNPTWKTKFVTLIDDDSNLALHVQVHSREPIFLRERLQGTATILLKEFLAKYKTASNAAGTEEEVGSYQLRSRDSNKVQGFIDISIRLSADSKETSPAHPGTTFFHKLAASRSLHDPISHPTGIYGGFSSTDNSDTITLSTEDGPAPTYHPKLHSIPATRPGSQSSSLPHPAPAPDHNVTGGPTDKPIGGPSNHAPGRTPPPPSNVGLVPTFLPTTDYMNMPRRDTSGRGGRRPRPRPSAAAMGAGAGALAAGALIFGDDFMSGCNFPTGLRDPNLTVCTDPPF